MSALKYWVFPREEVACLTASCPIPSAFLKNWESVRPGVLDDASQDIFAPNSRSHRQAHTRYDLFERVSHPHECDFCVLQNWLEICLASGVPQNIQPLIDAVHEDSAGMPVVISWNHDRDAATVPELQSLDDNFIVLQYNTSKPTPNDLLTPFWNINCSLPTNDNTQRTWKASFVGQAGGDVRRRIKYAFQSRPGYLFTEDRRPESAYLDIMRDSWFSLCPRGGGLSSYRLSESIVNESIPVLFADDYSLPLPDLDWRSFCVRIPERLAGDIVAVETVLDAVDRDAMLAAMRRVKHEFGLAGVQERICKQIMEMLAT